MTRSGEQASELAGGISCDEALALVRQFARAELRGEDARKMRAHTVGCPDCMSSYRTAMEVAAQLGRTTRSEREARQKLARREAQRSAALEGGAIERKHSRFRLRTILYPALIIALALLVWKNPTSPGPRFVLESFEGDVDVLGRSATKYSHPPVMRMDATCSTGADSSAVIAGDACRLELAELTQLFVHEVDPPRFKLTAGSLDLEGSAVFVTQLGILSVAEGHGRVQLDGLGLHVLPFAGEWTFSDAVGDTALELSQKFLVEPLLAR